MKNIRQKLTGSLNKKIPINIQFTFSVLNLLLRFYNDGQFVVNLAKGTASHWNSSSYILHLANRFPSKKASIYETFSNDKK